MSTAPSRPRAQETCGPIAQQIAHQWGLTILEEVPGASAALLLHVETADGAEGVLKVPLPADDEVGSWIGVSAFALSGGVWLTRFDTDTGALLMPRLRPGTKLADSELTDLEAVDVCSDLILKLRQTPVTAKTDLARWFVQLDRAESTPQVIEARRIARDLLDTTERVVNLHGDLHQYNIVLDGDQWRVIDPKFLVGDASHEIVGFMRNDMERAKDSKGMRARLERFAARLGDPIERLWGWSFAQTVLCGAWSSGSAGPMMWQDSIDAIWEAKP